MYAKVFSSLWDGSMRGQSDKQLVFIYLLAHADADGVAEIIQGKIADDTGLREEEVFSALSELMAPDPASRTDGNDGRRLEPLDARGWGWSIVNYQHYRGLRDDETRRQQTREAVRRFRDKKADVSHGKPRKAQGEGEGKAEVEVYPPPSTSVELELRSTSPPVFELMLNDGKTYPITQEQVSRWEGLYPAVDVPQTIREMIGWLEANPTKRKTHRGVLRFIVSWLSREQDKG
jgi:hypothetical protein